MNKFNFLLFLLISVNVANAQIPLPIINQNITNCALVNKRKGTCRVCGEGYWLNNGTCYKVTATNCLATDGVTNTCVSCLSNYAFDQNSGNCVVISAEVLRALPVKLPDTRAGIRAIINLNPNIGPSFPLCETNKFHTEYHICPSNPNLLIQLSLMHIPSGSGYLARATTACFNIAGSGPLVSQSSFNYAKVYGYHGGPHCNASFLFNIPPLPISDQWDNVNSVVHQVSISGGIMSGWVKGRHVTTCCPPSPITFTTPVWDTILTW